MKQIKAHVSLSILGLVPCVLSDVLSRVLCCAVQVMETKDAAVRDELYEEAQLLRRRQQDYKSELVGLPGGKQTALVNCHPQQKFAQMACCVEHTRLYVFAQRGQDIGPVCSAPTSIGHAPYQAQLSAAASDGCLTAAAAAAVVCRHCIVSLCV